MADQDNPKVLQAFHRGAAHGAEGGARVAVKVLIQGTVTIALMGLARLVLGVEWNHLFFGGGTGIGIGIAMAAGSRKRNTAEPLPDLTTERIDRWSSA